MLPQLTDEQRQAALAKAAEARKARAAFTERIRKGELTLAQVFDQAASDPDGCPAAKMKVTQVLKALPGVGTQTVTRLVEEIGISATRRVRGLGEQQKRLLLEAVTK